MAKNDKAPQSAAEEPGASGDSAPTPEPADLPTVGEHYAALRPPRFHHDCAAALHGWKQHLHHAGSAMRLTPENYQAAIVAALNGSGDVPHEPALSPHRGKGI